MEAFWGFLGAAIGAAKGAYSAIFAAYWETTARPMTSGDLFGVNLFFVCFFLAVMLLIVSQSRGSRASDLVKTIRDRKKISDVSG